MEEVKGKLRIMDTLGIKTNLLRKYGIDRKTIFYEQRK